MFCCCLSVSVFLVITAIHSGGARFTESPRDQEPVEGSSFSVTCSAVGALFLVWYKEGKAIPDSSQDYNQSSVTVGSTTLSVSAAIHSVHTGNYECVVIFHNSSMDNAPFSINVKYIDSVIGIRLTVLGSNCSVAGGIDVPAGCLMNFHCDPPDGYPNITLMWYRNGDILQQTKRMEISEDDRGLTIGDASFEDSASYQCRASNGIGITRHSQTLTVSVRGAGHGLRFLERENASSCEAGSAANVAEGGTLQLSCCVVDAVGSVEFQWLVAGRAELVEGGRLSIFSTGNSSTLQVLGAAVEDEGVYCCIASDYLSTIKRNVSVSIMIRRAIVEWPPPEVQGREGDRALFDCIASGRPVPVVIWLFQSTPVPMAPAGTGLRDMGNGSLLIPVLQQWHSGTYLCMLKEPPLDIRSFSLTVEVGLSPSTSWASSPTPTVALPHNSNDFTIGPFSELVSIVVVSLCGLGLLLPVSALLLSLCCCWRRHSRKKKAREMSVSRERVQYTIPAESYLFLSYGGNNEGMEGGGGACGNGVARHRERRLPLPPEPEIGIGGESYYEELDEVAVDVTSGVTLPRFPTFCSETSEAGGTELETVISAATDTQLVTS